MLTDGVNLDFSVMAVPLNRKPVVAFLLTAEHRPRGAEVAIVEQRPTLAHRQRWLADLRDAAPPSIDMLLAIDDPHTHLIPTHTDRLVPRQFLQEPDFLTRNMGGWAAIYFGVIGLPPNAPSDSILQHAKVLNEYGQQIHFFGADSAQVSARLPEEVNLTVQQCAQALGRLCQIQYAPEQTRMQSAERLYKEIKTGNNCAQADQRPLPLPMLYDALMDDLVHIELSRRNAHAEGDRAHADTLTHWLQRQYEEHHLTFILKGEYIMGRHRRSTILIAPELGVVVKQPAPEPFHDVALGAVEHDGKPENWPHLEHDGSFVTPRGRIRLVVEQDTVPRLYRAFRHDAHFSTLFGLTFEKHVPGLTLQQAVWADPVVLTAHVYEQIVLHQLVCEWLQADNGDWHSANFIVAQDGQTLTHIDWGAARPLQAQQLSEDKADARFQQVMNIAYSFHDDDLAQRVIGLHHALLADQARLNRLKQQADQIIRSI